MQCEAEVCGARDPKRCRLITCLVPPGSTRSEKGEATREARGAQQVDNLLARALNAHAFQAQGLNFEEIRDAHRPSIQSDDHGRLY